MPSTLHEVLVLLFRNRPRLAAELIGGSLGAPVPAFREARVEDASLGSVTPTELQADLVVRLEGDRPTALVVEVQLGKDPDKTWSWPAYVATLRARLRCETMLVVVCVDEAVATWCARPILLGAPGNVVTPLVVGPRAVPEVTDPEQAMAAPELAVLSVLAHGQSAAAEAIGKAALAAAARLDDARAALYADLTLGMVHEAAKKALEAMMASGNYEYQSEFARKYFGQGRAEGEARGKALGLHEGLALGLQEGLTKGKAEALLAVLAARGLPVSPELRERVLGCTDIGRLEAWLTRAVSAASAAEAVGE